MCAAADSVKHLSIVSGQHSLCMRGSMCLLLRSCGLETLSLPFTLVGWQGGGGAAAPGDHHARTPGLTSGCFPSPGIAALWWSSCECTIILSFCNMGGRGGQSESLR